ncbi:MAG TPA: Rv3654c family TadE-like protein [Nocardioidaceae bacterium]|nr:Rv3654c family TadE-like protein [Nocardioidaceae bacterium]
MTRPEQGSVTPYAVMAVAVLTAVAMVAAAVAGVVVGQRRSAAAADLAALAGAAALQRGEAACPAAGDVASANGASMRACDPVGEEVGVEVEMEVRTLLGLTWTASDEARAGPVP